MRYNVTIDAGDKHDVFGQVLGRGAGNESRIQEVRCDPGGNAHRLVTRVPQQLLPTLGYVSPKHAFDDDAAAMVRESHQYLKRILDVREEACSTMLQLMREINKMSLGKFQADVLATRAEYKRSDAILAEMRIGWSHAFLSSCYSRASRYLIANFVRDIRKLSIGLVLVELKRLAMDFENADGFQEQLMGFKNSFKCRMGGKDLSNVQLNSNSEDWRRAEHGGENAELGCENGAALLQLECCSPAYF